MSVQIVLDVTSEYLSGSESGTPYLIKLDIGGYDYAVVQFVYGGASGSFDLFHTNDSGAIQGVSDGSAVSSNNNVAVQGIDLASGTGVTQVSGDAIVRFQSIARYLWIDGSGDEIAIDKLLVRLYKIH
jgi:hypothetical protein